jgi:Beta-ketoacyl synthase, C-terminal domain
MISNAVSVHLRLFTSTTCWRSGVSEHCNAILCACSQVGGLQMHGTGTPLGDPIEVGAAAAVMQVRLILARHACSAGSASCQAVTWPGPN